MSTTILIILGLSVLALIIGVILAAGDGRPKVTHVDRTITKEKDGHDA